MAASEPGQSATALVALARMGSRPSQTSVGKESSVPPPATELIMPAQNPAPKMMAAVSHCIGGD